MKKTILLLILLIGMIAGLAQEPIKHEKKIYVGPDGKLFIQKSLPVYLRIATSPEDGATSHLLRSQQSEKYTNPMYFDTEGWNTFRSPSAVDTSTLKTINPLQNIIFEVYADGIAPVTKAVFSKVKSFLSPGKFFYGKGLHIELSSFDEVSGVETIYYSINGSPYKPYSPVLDMQEEKDYVVKYYSVDHVGNAEGPREKVFTTDLTPPESKYVIEGMQTGSYISPKSKLLLESTDRLSGVNTIYYKVNNGPEQKYGAPISVSILKSNTNIVFYAVDNVGNTEEKKVINSFSETKNGEGAGKSIFDFYIDYEPPQVNLVVEGDQFEGSYYFISQRSQVHLDATDEKSGVDKVFYGINTNTAPELYTGPFTCTKGKLQQVMFFAIDFVENKSVVKSKLLYLDSTSPNTKLTFSENKFFNRDTLFIAGSTRLLMSAGDEGSGVSKITYALDNMAPVVYEKGVMVNTDGFHSIKYYATDHVNNMEEEKQAWFFVDNIPPEIFTHFSVESIGGKTVRDEQYIIYPSNAKLYIAATDNAAGGEKIEYTVNGGAPEAVIPLEGLAPGNYSVEIIAGDMLHNKSRKTIMFSIEK